MFVTRRLRDSLALDRNLALLVGGADAAGLNAKAYARVISNGTFDATRSRNVTAITKPSTGFYCISVSVNVKNVVVSVNAVSAPAIAMAGLVGATIDGGFTCPTTAKIFVRTVNAAGTAAVGQCAST